MKLKRGHVELKSSLLKSDLDQKYVGQRNVMLSISV